jgi:archaellum component FlaC
MTENHGPQVQYLLNKVAELERLVKDLRKDVEHLESFRIYTETDLYLIKTSIEELEDRK